MNIAIFVIGSLLIAATVLPLLKADAWWVRIFDFPRIQITILLIIVFAVFVLMGHPWGVAEGIFALALFLAVVYQSYMMFPYLPIARKQVQQSGSPREDSTVSLFFANVLQENRSAEKLLRLIADCEPDLILVVETDDWWQGQLSDLEASHPFTVMQPQDDTYGMILYSRLELIEPEVKFLVEKNVPSIHTSMVLRSGVKVAIRCLHPPPPIPTFKTRSLERDVELIIVGKEVSAMDAPTVVFGDLNDVAWSRTNYLFQDVSGLLDPRRGRGFYNTFHAKIPFLRFPLDHCFHSNHFRLVDFTRLPGCGSDHFPVFIKLSYEADAEFHQEEPEADSSQINEADEKIEKIEDEERSS